MPITNGSMFALTKHQHIPLSVDPGYVGKQILILLTNNGTSVLHLTPFGLQRLSVATVLAWGWLEKLVNKQGSHIHRSTVSLFENGLW